MKTLMREPSRQNFLIVLIGLNGAKSEVSIRRVVPSEWFSVSTVDLVEIKL